MHGLEFRVWGFGVVCVHVGVERAGLGFRV